MVENVENNCKTICKLEVSNKNFILTKHNGTIITFLWKFTQVYLDLMLNVDTPRRVFCKDEELRRWEQKCMSGIVLANANLSNHFGKTETTPPQWQP